MAQAGGATTLVARVRSRSTRRRSSDTGNRSWTWSSWSAPSILQLQQASAVALRFFAPFSRVYLKKNKSDRFF